jgi:hypothetical protein
MDVRIFSNSGRPGVGQRPRREGQRPLLPQHARHCPVLVAGCALGFLVVPPLEPHDSAHIAYEGEGRYLVSFFLAAGGAKWDKVFTVAFQLAMGGIGAISEFVEFKKPELTDQNAINMAKAFIVPEDLGTPPGAISLCGATNFRRRPGGIRSTRRSSTDRTSGGADAGRARRNRLVRAPDRDSATCCSRVRRASATRCRSAGWPSCRADINLVDGTAEEQKGFSASIAAFFKEKGEHKVASPYGLQFSPAPAHESRR